MGYIKNNIKCFIKYKEVLLFSLLLFVMLVNSTNITPSTTDLKIRTALIFIFILINSIIAYFLTNSRVEKIFKLQFNKLLSSYSWGFKKIVSFYFIFDLLQLLAINIMACGAYMLHDGIFNNFHAAEAFTSAIPSYYIVVTIISAAIVILLIHYSLTILTKDFIGNISALIIVLFCSLNLGVIQNLPCIAIFTDVTGIRFYMGKNIPFDASIFMLNRLFFILFTTSIFLFSIFCHNRAILEHLSERIDFNRKSNNSTHFFRGSLPSLIKYHWSYVWNNKLFIVIFLLFSFIILIEATRSNVDEFHVLRQYTPMVLQNRFEDESSQIVMTIIAVFIPLNLFNALRSNKFYKLTHALPLSNISIAIAVYVVTVALFFTFVSVRAIINIIAIYISSDSSNLELILWVFRSLISSSWSYLFLMTGIIILLLAIEKKILAIISLCGIFMFNMWLIKLTRYNDLSPNWLLICWGYLPQTTISDINPDMSRHEFRIYYQYLIYWSSLSVLLIASLSPFYARGEERSFTSRIMSGCLERKNRTFISIIVSTLIISILSGYGIYSTQEKRNKQQSTDSKAIKEYSSLYKHFFSIPTPTINSALFKIDLYPSEERLKVYGKYQLKNSTDTKIDTLAFTIPLRDDTSIELESLTLNTPNKTIINDSIHNFFVVKLITPISPNDSIELNYILNISDRGERNRRSVYISPKWSLIRSSYFAIYPGFYIGRESLSTQEKFYNKIPSTHLQTDFNHHTKIDVIVSAPKEQTIISDGLLTTHTENNSRKYHHYKSLNRGNLFNFPIIASSQYEKIDTSVNGRLINLYYNPIHQSASSHILKNATSIISNYCSTYGEIDLSEINIVEAANYRGNGGSSFTNTLFFSENQFTANFSDTTHLIRANSVLAHELAHFWWSGLQPFDFMAKSAVAYEGLSEYSSIQQLELIHNHNITRNYIKYLINNINWQDKLPLYETDDKDAIYSKAPLIFRRISKIIGKEQFDDILKSFITNNNGNPSTLNKLISYIKEQSPQDSLIIEELFSQNIIYKNSLISAKIYNYNNLHKIDIEYSLNKEKQATTIPFLNREIIDITFLKEDKIIYSENIKASSGVFKFSTTLNEIPDKVILDYNTLYIDNYNDNEIVVEKVP